MHRTMVAEDGYVAALDVIFPNPMLADEWQRAKVDQVLAQETTFDVDVYQTHRSGDAVWRVFITDKTAELPRMIVFFTPGEDKIILQSLAVLPVYEAPPLAPAQQALAF